MREKSCYSSSSGVFFTKLKNPRHKFETRYFAGKRVGKNEKRFKKATFLIQRRKVTNSKNAILAAHDEGFCNAYVCTAKIYNKKYNPKGRNKFGFEIFLSLLIWYSAMKNIWIKQSAAAVHIFQPNFHFWNVPAFFPIPSIFMCKHSPMCFVMSRQKCVKTKQLHLTPFLIVPSTHYYVVILYSSSLLYVGALYYKTLILLCK